MTFVVGYSCYSGNRSSSRISNSLEVALIVSGKASIQAKSLRFQTCALKLQYLNYLFLYIIFLALHINLKFYVEEILYLPLWK